jgi:hypothetical protein
MRFISPLEVVGALLPECSPFPSSCSAVDVLRRVCAPRLWIAERMRGPKTKSTTIGSKGRPVVEPTTCQMLPGTSDSTLALDCGTYSVNPPLGKNVPGKLGFE